MEAMKDDMMTLVQQLQEADKRSTHLASLVHGAHPVSVKNEPGYNSGSPADLLEGDRLANVAESSFAIDQANKIKELEKLLRSRGDKVLPLIHSYTHTRIHSYTHTLIHSYTRTLVYSGTWL